ncbi:MAG TPA: DUF1634 domain-containing protein [Terriglobales bacterium]|nr:DUF1634 domain-containing protein [Terriglobales bacterium]
MTDQRAAWSDEKTEQIIGNLLRFGVMTAAGVVLGGGILYLVRHGGEHVNYRVFRGEPENFRSLPGIVSSALSLHARGIIQFGLLLLIATPVARVLFSAFAFVLERDWLYVVVTLIVFAVLVFSLMGGKV